jgi:cytochrome P450
MENEMNARAALRPDIDFGFDEVTNLYDVLDELRQHGSVVPVNYIGSPAWLVVGHAEVNQVFIDEANFPAAEGYLELAAPSMGRTVNVMTGPELRTHRAALTPPFLPPKVRSYIEPLIEPIAHELMDAIEGQTEVDLVDAFTRPYPFRVITRLLGIPVSDEELLLKWAVGIVSFPWDPEGALQTKREFDAYMLNIMEQRRRNPGDDFISSMVAAQKEGKFQSDEEILSFLRILYPAGSDTTYKASGSLFASVLSDPKLIAMAKGSYEERQAVVLESLRLRPPTVFIPRKAAADAHVGGVDIKKGDWMILAISGANRDSKVFPDPHTFDPTRKSAGDMITFGRGVHFCLGLHLARREMETALRVVFTRFPDMRLKPGSEIEFFTDGIQRGPRELRVQPLGHD